MKPNNKSKLASILWQVQYSSIVADVQYSVYILGIVHMSIFYFSFASSLLSCCLQKRDFADRFTVIGEGEGASKVGF